MACKNALDLFQGKLDGDDNLSSCDLIGIYFSAHWCPPCRGFTPTLADFYKEAKDEKFQIVFVSFDRDETSFNTYFKEMPWLALKFGGDTEDIKKSLADTFKVSGIPMLVILDKDGNVKEKNARSTVEANKDNPAKCIADWRK